MSFRHPHNLKPELDAILRREDEILHELGELQPQLQIHHPRHITFKEISMNPTAAGQTQVFTGTLTPAGSSFPADSVFGVTSNDPAVSPSVDASGLVVSVTYPEGWTESTSTPLAFSYTASSASTGMSITATITPSAPVVIPTGISFTQTT